MKPESWTIGQTVDFFGNGTTRHMVRVAKKLRAEHGILAKPTRKTRRDKIKPEIIQAAIDFYHQDDVSRIMPGKKDCVSVAYKVHEQKRLLLNTLSEIYEQYKERYPNEDERVGFTMFCSLKPKCCVKVGSAGGHTVCVCSTHQNAVLAADAFGMDYKLLMGKLVCSTSDKICMVHRCPSCPGAESLKTFLKEQLTDEQSYADITFTQWETTDRATIETFSMPVFEFIDFLVERIDKLTSHSYIAKSQAAYLNRLKQDIRSNILHCPG